MFSSSTNSITSTFRPMNESRLGIIPYKSIVCDQVLFIP